MQRVNLARWRGEPLLREDLRRRTHPLRHAAWAARLLMEVEGASLTEWQPCDEPRLYVCITVHPSQRSFSERPISTGVTVLTLKTSPMCVIIH